VKRTLTLPSVILCVMEIIILSHCKGEEQKSEQQESAVETALCGMKLYVFFAHDVSVLFI
jgi:hypothetical protein